MDNESDPTGRKPGDYLLFALAFSGFVAGSAGVVASSVTLALGGAIILLLALLGFLPRD